MSLKLVVVGDVGVGKTSLLNRVFFNSFSESESTVGASFLTKSFNGITVNVWDTAGQERYRALLPMYVRDADVAWIVTDGSNVDFWNHFILEKRGNECVRLTVQTKSDLHGTSEEVDADFVTSAKDNMGCESLLKATISITPPSDKSHRYGYLCIENNQKSNTCC